MQKTWNDQSNFDKEGGRSLLHVFRIYYEVNSNQNTMI